MANDLGPRGRRLWDAFLVQDPTLSDDANPARAIAVSACRTADRVELLEVRSAKTDPVVEGRSGLMIHPLFAEVRQQSALLARLVAALRLPDAVSGKRPQHRQVRGVQQPTAVSSLDRARARAAGGS